MGEEGSRERIQKMMENIHMVPVQYIHVERDNVQSFKEGLELISTQEISFSPSDIFEQVNPAGDSLLHTAAMFGSEKIVQYIASENPALLTKTNIKGDTALHIAVRGNKLNMIKNIVLSYKNLFGNKELLEIKNALGNTALHEAVIKNAHFTYKEDAADFLFYEHPEVVHYPNKECKSPLYIAVENGSIKLVEFMLENAVPLGKGKSLPSYTGVSPLHAAILERGKTSGTGMVELILGRGHEELKYLKDDEGNTPLHCAVSNGDHWAVLALLKDPRYAFKLGKFNEVGISNKFDRITLERNKEGQLPVHIACQRGHVEIVKLLVTWWPGPEKMVNNEGQNILHVAAESGEENVVNYILREPRLKDSLIAEKDNKGNSPLHLAVEGLHARILFPLTRNQKTNDLKLRNNEGYTARDIVSAHENAPMLQRIVSSMILYSAGASHSRKGKIRRRRRKEKPNGDSMKSRIETLMLIAILVATVTFAAGFTVPGGLNGSDEPNPEKRGMATLVHRGMFQAFTICNTIAMYSSILASFVFLWAQVSDSHLAINAYKLGLTLVGVALATMSVAFMAAVQLVVGNLRWLGYIVMSIATCFLLIFLLLYTLYTYPYRATLPLMHYISDHVIKALLLVTGSHKMRLAGSLEDFVYYSDYYAQSEPLQDIEERFNAQSKPKIAC